MRHVFPPIVTWPPLLLVAGSRIVSTMTPSSFESWFTSILLTHMPRHTVAAVYAILIFSFSLVFPLAELLMGLSVSDSDSLSPPKGLLSAGRILLG